MWVQPHQDHLSTLVEAAQKLMLLADDSADWLYAFLCMNDTMLHVSCVIRDTSALWHIVYTVQMPVVGFTATGVEVAATQWPCGVPRGTKWGVQGSFQELPLWNAATMDGPTQDLPLIEVALGGTESKTANTTPVPPPSSYQTSTWHCCGSQPTPPGGLGMAAVDFSCHLSPASQHSTSRMKLPSVALVALPPPEQEIHSAGRGQTWPSLIWQPPLYRHPQVRLHQNTSPAPFRSVTPLPSLPCQKLWMWPVSPLVYSLKPPRASPTDLPDEVLWLQGENNVAMEWLLMIKATLNSCQRELAWNADIAMCQNDTKATEAIKEAEVQCAATIREVESYCAAMIKEAETHCEVTIKEVEPVVLSKLMLWNNPMRKVCLSWSVRH